MRKKKGLSKSQKIFIILLWAALCVMLFTIPNDKSLAENILYAVASGIIILVGITVGKNKTDKHNRK